MSSGRIQARNLLNCCFCYRGNSVSGRLKRLSGHTSHTMIIGGRGNSPYKAKSTEIQLHESDWIDQATYFILLLCSWVKHCRFLYCCYSVLAFDSSSLNSQLSNRIVTLKATQLRYSIHYEMVFRRERRK